MKTYTIFSSETVVYRTEIKANSNDEALDIFYNNHVVPVKLVADAYEGFQVDNIEEGV